MLVQGMNLQRNSIDMKLPPEFSSEFKVISCFKVIKVETVIDN